MQKKTFVNNQTSPYVKLGLALIILTNVLDKSRCPFIQRRDAMLRKLLIIIGFRLKFRNTYERSVRGESVDFFLSWCEYVK